MSTSGASWRPTVLVGRFVSKQLAEVAELVRNNKMIKAIKVYRELVPEAGLAEAKNAVEQRAGRA